jgi:hypothetical protein
MVCTIRFKQNVGHLGKDIVVSGVHGHYRTMKIAWKREFTDFWDRLARYALHSGINFLAGDFNKSINEVPKQLRNRGIYCDCVPWYPWQQAANSAAAESTEQRLGFDSCGIFFIGGRVQVYTPQVSSHLNIEDLAAVADWEVEGLDVYDGTNVPGQPWHCYRSRAYQERPDEKDLEARLRDLLMPSTTPEELAMIPTREGVEYCPDLRLTQRNMEQDEWLVEGFVHNGGHWRQCVRTQKASARREEKIKELAQRRQGEKGKGDHKGEGNGKKIRAYTAVAEHTYFGKPMNKGDGKGKNSSWAAVADDGRGWDGSWAAASSSGSWSAGADDSRGWDEWVLVRRGASSSGSWSAVADYGSGGITGVASNIMSPSSPLHLPQSRRN